MVCRMVCRSFEIVSMSAASEDYLQKEKIMSLRKSLGFAIAGLALGFVPAARATVFQYQAILDGPSESPANASPGTGFTSVDYDNVAHTLHVQATFSGLLGTTTASHIHSATAA